MSNKIFWASIVLVLGIIVTALMITPVEAASKNRIMFERRVKRDLEADGWFVKRTVGSGLPDVIGVRYHTDETTGFQYVDTLFVMAKPHCCTTDSDETRLARFQALVCDLHVRGWLATLNEQGDIIYESHTCLYIEE